MTTGTAVAARSLSNGTLTGTGTLVRFMLRRDRIRMPAWVLGLTLATVVTAVSFASTYPDAASRALIATTMKNPAMVAMAGVNYSPDNYTYGVMMGHEMLWFTAILIGLMSILLLNRHTRAEEASGRAELVRSGVVGRHAGTAAALIVVGIANIAAGLLIAAGLALSGVESIGWQGSLLYGAAHAAVGLVFAGVAAVTAQISENSRATASMAVAVLGLAYVLRAVGDITGGGLSWLSPIGWAQATHVYAENRWWPLLFAVAAVGVLTAVAFNLSTRRDVGAGLRQPKPGPASASGLLTNPYGFAWRLHRGTVIGWTVAIFLLGVSYGSVLGSAETLLENLNIKDILAGFGNIDIVMSFAAMVTTVSSIIASVYAVLAIQRMRSEETAGRAEPLLATGLSRTRWVVTHLAIVTAGSVAVLLAGGLGLGIAGAISTGNATLLPKMLGAFIAYLPALWVTMAVAVALFGLLPQLMSAAWALIGYAFFVVYLGGILGLPEWMKDLSPFGQVPQMPAKSFEVLPLIALAATAAALTAIGLVTFRRRDLQSPT